MSVAQIALHSIIAAPRPARALPPVNLAWEADFCLGALDVSPSSREVTRAGWTESLEPRVMQVLVALHQARESVVSRDDLIARCWDGRIVGDDAINRAIGQLRRLSKADRGGSFVIETVPRVGYRLRHATASIGSLRVFLRRLFKR
jgi:DNA-binding winged helix-turn-helix (wHTH) protein